MKSWNLVIDLALCHDCNDCFLADKDEFVDNDFSPLSAAQPWHGHRWMNIERAERGQYPIVQTSYLPKPCQHCDAAPCLTADGAVYKRDDGLVIIDPVKAVGRREIVASCPYDVIYWNDEKQLPQKCTGCAHLIDQGWHDTRCSQVCPTGAIRLVLADDDEMARLAGDEGLQALRPELGTRPRVRYRNLHRWTRALVAVSVVFADSDDCAEGARVSLALDGEPVAEGLTNNYGDVVLDDLEPGREYTLTVTADGYRAATMAVKLDTSRTLDKVFLQKA
ncbi:MAG TPA: 4Fe-4S dicluster domain-containing protein [Thermoleophilia bacterium]|nr:4Fe-4S dicluster domain-containing protein [Thermoleophilia bacterium]